MIVVIDGRMLLTKCYLVPEELKRQVTAPLVVVACRKIWFGHFCHRPKLLSWRQVPWSIVHKLMRDAWEKTRSYHKQSRDPNHLMSCAHSSEKEQARKRKSYLHSRFSRDDRYEPLLLFFPRAALTHNVQRSIWSFYAIWLFDRWTIYHKQFRSYSLVHLQLQHPLFCA